jgi:hypothetical protein
VYKTTNIENKKFYIGVHKNKLSQFDGYLGSGTLLKKAIKNLGSSKFIRETLYAYDNPEDAYVKERELVSKEQVKNPNCYNIAIGGRGLKSNNYDFSNPMKNPKVKEKTRLTVKNSYGVTNVMKDETIKLKQINSAIKNYGDHPMRVPHLVDKYKKSTREKTLIRYKTIFPTILNDIEIYDFNTKEKVWEGKLYNVNRYFEKEPVKLNKATIKFVYNNLSSNIENKKYFCFSKIKYFALYK